MSVAGRQFPQALLVIDASLRSCGEGENSSDVRKGQLAVMTDGSHEKDEDEAGGDDDDEDGGEAVDVGEGHEEGRLVGGPGKVDEGDVGTVNEESDAGPKEALPGRRRRCICRR